MNTMNMNPTMEERKAWALWALLFFIPLFLKTKTEFVTFYMKQNFWIFIASIIFQILLQVLLQLTFMFSGNIVEISNAWWKVSTIIMLFYYVFITLFSLIWFVLFVLAIILIVKAYKWKRYEIPYLLKYTDLIISKIPFLQKIFSPK